MKKEKVTKKSTKKVDWERANNIAHLLSIYSQFMPRIDSGEIPLLSKEFVFKNLLGLTDEEFDTNEKLLFQESTTLLNAINKHKSALEAMQKEANQELQEMFDDEPKKKSKKQKVN